MDPKREAQLKSSAEALAVLTFNFIQAIKRAAEDFQTGVEEVERGNGPLPVQIPDLNVANENVIGERRKQNSPSERKVRPATGPMLGTPNKSNGVLTSDKSTKAMVGQSSEPKAEIEKDTTTPEHSTHSTPEGKIANANLGVALSSEIVEKGVVKKVRDEQDDVENNQEGFSDRNGRDDETPPPAKRACI